MVHVDFSIAPSPWSARLNLREDDSENDDFMGEMDFDSNENGGFAILVTCTDNYAFTSVDGAFCHSLVHGDVTMLKIKSSLIYDPPVVSSLRQSLC
jgi:hypothetical protein